MDGALHRSPSQSPLVAAIDDDDNNNDNDDDDVYMLQDAMDAATATATSVEWTTKEDFVLNFLL